MVEMQSLQKLTWFVNTVLVGCMVMALLSFRYYGVTYMAYYCIPTIAVLLGLYYLIHKQKLYLFALLVYIDLVAYMIAGTICLGYNTGFHLYCMSLIPLTFYMEYMAYKLQIKKMSAMLASLMLVAANLISTGYVTTKGPVYQLEPAIARNFMYVNAVIVFCFLISYSSMMLKWVMNSENKLTDMANTDRLTGLFNRHYMMSHLDALYQSPTDGQWLAMADIDDFKKINDTYGHDCGDYVLVELARILREVCQGCTISRWGGEEFLIISNSDALQPQVLETLRQRVEQTPFSHQGRDFSFTITIGVSGYQAQRSLSSWIQSADAKLYEGKSNNKNCVVY